MIYLDNAAATKPSKQAMDKAAFIQNLCYANPAAQHKFGLLAAQELEQARTHVAGAMNAPPNRVFFTSGGTESINTAIHGALYLNRRKGKHILTCKTEHMSVLSPLKHLEANGYQVDYLPPLPSGAVDADAVLNACREDTALVALMAVNNQTGAQNPVEQIAVRLKAEHPQVLFAVDGVAGFLKMPLDLKDIDFYSVSGHKAHAPKGSGALYVRSGLNLPPLIHGGGQENGLRSGTPGLEAIAGFGQACLIGAQNFERDTAYMRTILNRAKTGLEALGGKVIGSPDAPHILCIAISQDRSEVLMRKLEQREIYISAASACTQNKKNHVLAAMNLGKNLADSAIRISISGLNTPAEIDKFIAAADSIIKGEPL